MLYELSYTRDGRFETVQASYAQACALAEYLGRTFRIVVEMRRVG